MPGISQHTSQEGCNLELLDSVTGSVAACGNIARKLVTLSGTTAACLSGPLDLVIARFNSMSQSYTKVEDLLQRPDRVRGQNVSLSIRFTQKCCQQIATEVAVILGKHGEWDVLADDGSYHRLNMLSKNLEVLKTHHDLLFKTLGLMPTLFTKPAEHESPASIVIPVFSEEWTLQFTAAQWAEYKTLRERQRIAYAAAHEMDRWSKEYASSLGIVQETLRSMKNSSKELLDYQISRKLFQGPGSLSLSSEELPDEADEALTQSTMDITTPTEDWSNVGSDITERGRAPTITRHSLQLCGYATASFLRLAEESCQDMPPWGTLAEERVQRLHKAYADLVVHLLHVLDAPVPFQGHPVRSPFVQLQVTSNKLYSCIQDTERFLERNNAIELSFNQLPGSTPVDAADIEAMHEAYDVLVYELCDNLAAPIPFQGYCPTSGPAPVMRPAPEVSKPFMFEEEKSDVYIDKPLQAIIDSMESKPTDQDIMKLIFHWTTLNECNGFERADVLKIG